MGYLIFRAIVFALLLVSVSGYSQNIEQLKKDIAYLASDELEGREAGTEGAYKAGKYLKARFVEEGLKPHRGGDYFQEFYVIPAKNPHEMAKLGEASDSALTVRNVVGFLDNGAKMTVVIGAHFDHLGYGGVNSLFREGEAVHNGADDNASGTAALMQIAQMLKGKNKNNNYLFIAFTGEEKGLWGSNYFCKNPLIDLNTVNYMINMDMIG
ncbi:MAG: M28 family peptidase, partial [Cyclobacteriaceae bacterium]|nr:M28 family peptidase [Cyclobacteriaceae bacterium]